MYTLCLTKGKETKHNEQTLLYLTFTFCTIIPSLYIIILPLIHFSSPVLISHFQITFCAVATLAVALPQRRAPAKPEQQQQLDDQQAAEQNYNNYQPQQDYRQQQQQQQQQQQPQQQEYRQAKQIDDFRPKVQLETTTYIPIIHFDKEQGTDGSYKTS